jgi:HEPN domain-containing protein
MMPKDTNGNTRDENTIARLARSCQEKDTQIADQDGRIKVLTDTGKQAFEFYIKATIMHHDRFHDMADMALDIIDHAEKMESEIAEQAALIENLEEAWIVADGNILSLRRDHLTLDRVSEEKRLRYREEALEALEKIKQGDRKL